MAHLIYRWYPRGVNPVIWIGLDSLTEPSIEKCHAAESGVIVMHKRATFLGPFKVSRKPSVSYDNTH